MAWINPKLDWIANPLNPTSEDLNRIEQNISFINSEIETKKGAIVDALVGVGISTLLTDTHATIATKIAAAEKIGVMLTPSASNQSIPKGIYDVGGGIVIGDSDLIAPNILSGKNIFGTAGSAIDGALMKRTANGSVLSPGTTEYILVVSGLSFRPKVVFVCTSIWGNQVRTQSLGIDGLNEAIKQAFTYSMSSNVLDTSLVNKTSAFSTSIGGFTIPVSTGGPSYTPTIYWVAIE